MRYRIIMAAGLIGCAGGLQAKVSQEQADRLCGPELTCIGAERKGNADGTIPEWVGRKSEHFPPQSFTITYEKLSSLSREEERALSAAVYADKPRLVITRENMAQHADKLTEGHRWLLTNYPTYKMPVYATERTGFFPETVEQATKRNAVTAELVGTDDVRNAVLGFPFPIPQNGAEVIWNHKMKYLAENARRYNNQAIVNLNGNYTITKLIEDVKFVYASIANPRPSNEGVLVYYMSETLSPPKDEGQILLVHELIGGEGRKAWLYNPGTRRVRLAPNVGYDNPALGTDNQQTNDQINVFNGSLDRYTWRLVGKREIYIPYNSVPINSRYVKFSDILKPRHINQDLTRYELHRVWVVEATLRAGTSHIFKKRVFYVDEDSWSIAAVDLYDGRDQLWKFQEAHLFTVPWIGTVTGIPELVYDFQSGRYFATTLTNEDRITDWTVTYDDRFFTTQNMTRRARR
jgi:hypothetical protein